MPRLLRALAVRLRGRTLTVEEIIALLGEDGLLLMAVICASPFLLPASIPGISTVAGTIILLVGMAVVAGHTPALPSRLLHARVGGEGWSKALMMAARVVKPLGRSRQPSRSAQVGLPLHGLSLAINGVVLLMPLPIPLSNFLPGWGAMLLATGLLKQGRRLLVAGHFSTFIGVAYVALTAVLGVEGAVRMLHH
ncbi:MAG: exopolysaccharide biosynthesis protein [Myxococcota bacterium]